MSGGGDVMALIRALAASGPAFTLEEAISRDWASATFAGERHLVRIRLADDAATRAWLRELPDLELRVRGRLVADLAVTEEVCADGRVRVAVEALTIEEG